MPSFHRNVVVSVLFTFLGGPALVLVLVPWYITHFQIPAEDSPARIVAAVAIIAVGLIPLFESIGRFVIKGRGTLMPAVPTEHLVATGLFRFVRNPMYIGVITALFGEALLFTSRHMLTYIAIVLLIMHVFVCVYEEPTLARKYGDEYAHFKQNVPRWIPRLRPWRPAVSSAQSPKPGTFPRPGVSK